MMESPDIKKKLIKQISDMAEVLAEHGLKGQVSDIGPSMAEFTVQTTKPLNRLVVSLYKRDGVERVLIQRGRAGRGIHPDLLC